MAIAAFGAVVLVGSLAPGVVGASPRNLYAIPLSSGVVDPLADFTSTDPASKDLVLVQFERFGDTVVVHRVAATGARMVQPLAPVSYLVWADKSQTRSIRALEGVRFAGVMPASARVSDSVNPRTRELRVTFVGKAPDSFASAITSTRAFTGITGTVVEAGGSMAAADTLSRLPRVYSVADAGGIPQLREERSNAIITSPAEGPIEPGYRDFLAEFGVDGTGVIVSHVDAGVDMNHPELSDRIEACIDYSRTGQLCTVRNHDDVIGHGTHTLGTVLGNGSTGLGDIEGFDYGLGTAPGATAVVQNPISFNTFGAGDPFDDGFVPVYKEAFDLGAIVSQNSWGPEGDPQGYDEDTREFDSIVRDLDPATEGDQAMALVFSIMNGSGGTSTQGSPDEGKNLIGVGASVDRGFPGFSGDIDDLCLCTAHGPALDGRLLPTLVAPGESVTSTRALQGTLCGAPFADGAETPPSPLHAGCTGTSMASPHVTGASALFIDYYRDHFEGATPSPALMKAALVNGATDLVGGLDADLEPMGPIPNNQQGWGRLNIRNVLESWRDGTVHVDQSVVFDASGQSHSVTVEPIDPSKPLKASLVWTDALGPGLGGETPAWINDLDLVVSGSTGETWLGNVFSKGMSVAGGEADRMNNIENVFIASPSGPYTVSVNAANIIGDGLPNLSGITDQDFALVITNARVIEEGGGEDCVQRGRSEKCHKPPGRPPDGPGGRPV